MNTARVVQVVIATLTVGAVVPASAQCTGDLNGSGFVNGTDLGMLLAEWGPSSGTADLNGDGFVDGTDLGMILAAWGICPPILVPAWSEIIEAQPDPAVITDPLLRAAIRATGLAWRVRDSATQIEMLLVPPGTFQMGETGWAEPVHEVTLTKPIYLGRYEVTQAQWRAKMGVNPSYFQTSNGVPGSESRPVERVSWLDVQGFLAATGMQLPTEAEWEYCCRAGTATAFHAMPGHPNGTNDGNQVGTIAWNMSNTCAVGSCGTRPVGQKAANSLGLHDMSGNVWEWVRDWFDAYPSSAQTNPQGPGSGTMRVIRGGAWSNGAAGVRSSSRAGFLPGATSDIVGFRVARDPYAVRVPAWATLIESQPDPSVVTDPVLRASIFATGLAWRVRDVATQIELVLIPPGTFQMGCVVGSDMYACTDLEQPVHQVTLTKAFYLGRHEVTQAQWTAKMGSNPSYFQGYPDSPSRPVERVSWSVIREQSFFGFPPRRLPTEAEWEFACRAGTSTPFYNGATNDATVTNLGWIAQNSGGETHAVGGKLANGLGLYDMLGNVSEWVNDRWGGYTSAPQIDPSGPVSGSNGVFRGGSCFMDTYWARSSNRDRYHSTSYNIGFRIAIDP